MSYKSARKDSKKVKFVGKKSTMTVFYRKSF